MPVAFSIATISLVVAFSYGHAGRLTALFGDFRPGQWQSWQAIAGKAVPVSKPMIEILDFLVVRAGGQD